MLAAVTKSSYPLVLQSKNVPFPAAEMSITRVAPFLWESGLSKVCIVVLTV